MTNEYRPEVTISINVSDWDVAKQFYGETLGLKFLYEVSEIGWAEFETAAPGTTLGINLVEAVAGDGGATPTLGVADVGASRTRLEAEGVKFDGDTVEVEGMVKLANFQDPFGNRLCLAESLMGG